jgi:CRISPR/Cas system CSM-associated protein Csm4 (group 5 of RAMP superfamily)
MEDGELAVYKYLSERLYESFLDNEQDSENDEEKIYINTVYNTSNKLSLKSYYTPFPDP